METAIKELLADQHQSFGTCLHQLTVANQSMRLSMETSCGLDLETLDLLDETLSGLKDSYPYFKMTNGLTDFTLELNKLVHERQNKRNLVSDSKQQLLKVKDDQENKLTQLKQEIEMLNDENHRIEERLKPDSGNLPLLLSLMGSLTSVPPTSNHHDRGVDDSIARHLESLLRQVEDT